MKIREELGQEMDLLRRWFLVSGRDVIATTRESLVSIEGRVGVWTFAGLWALGRMGAGEWHVWGRELGGEILPVVRTWYPGAMAFFQCLLLSAHVAVGIGWGIVVKNAWGLAGIAWPTIRRDRFRSWVAGTITGLTILLLHTALLLRDLARHPALYQETFLDRGGTAWVQRGASTALAGTGGTIVLGVAGVLAAAALGRLAQRMVVWFLGFARPTRVAIGVLGGALGLFACGIGFVRWTQMERNEGPNLLLISVDGLRGDRNPLDVKKEGSSVSRLFRRAGVKGFLVPPSIDFTPTLATGLTGRSPFGHGVRHDFPSAQDVAGDLGSLPGLLRSNGWETVFLADGPDGFLERMGREFERARVPPSALSARLFRRQVERSIHLMPYLSGGLGRRISLLRGSPFLSDPDLLAREAVGEIDHLQHQSKFFLWVHFSSLNPLCAVTSPRVAARMARARPAFFRRPGDGRTERPMTGDEWALLQRLYDENLNDFREALEVLLRGLERRGLEDHTVVILWSPRAALLSDREQVEARDFKGPAFLSTPFLAIPVSSRALGHPFSGGGRAVDLAPTAARLLQVPIPSDWEGVPLTEGFPQGEAGIIYSEESTPFAEGGPGDRVPPLIRLLEEDRDSPGHLRLAPAWEDPVLMFRDRAIRMGDETFVYHPGDIGVMFSYEKGNEFPLTSKQPATARAARARVKDLHDIFYRYLSRETGWRPQNDYWIPEAFLREEPGEDVRGN